MKHSGNFDSYAQLLRETYEMFTEGASLREMAAQVGVSVRSVRRMIAENKWTRDERHVSTEPEKKKEEVRASGVVLRLVPDPCVNPYCEDQGCPYHYAEFGNDR